MIDDLRMAIKNKEVILFVGAGISASLGLPTWSELIDHIASELDFDADLFKNYGDSLVLAEYYMDCKGGTSELGKWIEANWDINENDIEKSKIHRMIIELDFPLIYTTNYDDCLEKAFYVWGKKYQKIVCVSDLVKIDPKASQIIKFHGDTTTDTSIVLSESSYFDRLSFESPLDIKLRSDMLGKTLLFLGYSLSDINVRLLIYKLDQLWRNSNSSNRPASYIFLPTPNPIQEEVLSKRGIKAIVGDDLDKTKSIERFLESLL